MKKLKKLKLYFLNRLIAPFIFMLSDLIMTFVLILRIVVTPLFILILLFVNEKVANMMYDSFYTDDEKTKETKRLLKESEQLLKDLGTIDETK